MKRSIMLRRKLKQYTLAILFWLAVWQAASMLLPKLLFASPASTLAALLRFLQQGSFWLSIAHSLVKIGIGFLLATGLAIVLAALSSRVSMLRILLQPAVHAMKSIPVACFVIVALIFIRSAWLSIPVSFFVVFPVTYHSTLQAIGSMDKRLTEMAQVFRVPLGKRIKSLYVPQLISPMYACLRVTIGMSWKAGIAGEVIGLPALSIGEQLYLSKLYLATDELFAWIIVIACISFLIEKITLYGIGRAGRTKI